MNFTSRIFAGLLALVLMAAALLTIALVTGSMSPERLQFIDLARAWLEYLPTMGFQAVLTVVLAAAAVLIFALLILLMQFPRRKKQVLYLVREDEGGAFRIRKEAVIALIRYVGLAVHGVQEVTTRCTQREGGDLELSCRLLLRPIIDMVTAGRQFQESVRTELTGKTGLKVGTIDLVTNYSTKKPPRDERRAVK